MWSVIYLPKTSLEESGFSSLDSEFGTEEESASEMYREIQDEGLDRRSR
jgi:hypothetical protein